jgi:hypothetical protein
MFVIRIREGTGYAGASKQVIQHTLPSLLVWITPRRISLASLRVIPKMESCLLFSAFGIVDTVGWLRVESVDIRE